MKKLSVAAGLALALSAGSAFAADLPSRKGPPAYLPPPPMFSWTGLYGGVNIGYGFGSSSPESGWLAAAPAYYGGANQDLNGVLGGGQVGYNYQFSPWLVLGVEADIQAADLNTQNNLLGLGVPGVNLAHVNSAKSVDWFGTVRGRLGLTLPSVPNLMFFGTAGFAYGQVDHTVSLSNLYVAAPGPGVVTGRSKYFETATGWTAGGGVEWTPMAFPAWSLKVEYLYTDLGSSTQTNFGFLTNNPALPPFIGQHNSSTRFHTIRAGLNWHFNPFASAPVLAKY